MMSPNSSWESLRYTVRKTYELVPLNVSTPSLCHEVTVSPRFGRFRTKADLGMALTSDLNAVIMEYLISEGYPEAAQRFALEANIEPELDVDSIQERVEIREAIASGDIQNAIEKINELNPQVGPSSSLLLGCGLLAQSIAMIRYCSCTTHRPLRGADEKTTQTTSVFSLSNTI